jgi:predicted nucleic acid-binding protein
MSLVVDASVAVKWILDEDASARALALKELREELIAPSLVLAEIGNVLWKHVLRQTLSQADAALGLVHLAATFDRLEPLESLHKRAMALALQLQHPIYDCFYLAVAEREPAPLVTADRRLLAAAERLGTLEARGL